MPVLPILPLVLGSVSLLVLRRPTIRLAWGVASLALLAGLTVVLVLAPGAPSVARVSVWRPADLFTQPLSFSLDWLSLPVLLGMVSLGLAIVLTGPARGSGAGAGSRALLLGYLALGSVAILAGNLLTIVLALALVDLGTLIWLLLALRDPDRLRAVLTRFGFDAAGLLFLVAAGTGRGVPQELWVSPALLVLVAALLRLGLLPPQFQWPVVRGLRPGMETALRFVPPAVALTVLARQPGGPAPDAILPWLRVLGAVAALVASIRWALETRPGRGMGQLVLGAAGLAVFLAGVVPNLSAPLAASGAVLVLTAGALASLGGVRTPWHRLLPFLAAVALSGIPLSAAGPMAAALAQAGMTRATVGHAAVAVAAWGLLLAGLLRRAFDPPLPWEASEDLARAAYAVGLAVPVACALLVGWWFPRSEPDVAMITAFLVVGAAVSTLVLARRLPEETRDRATRMVLWLDLSPLLGLVTSGLRAALAVFLLLAGGFEGRGGMLWILALVLLGALALGR